MGNLKNLSFEILGIEHAGVALEELDIASKFLSLLPGITKTGSENIHDQQVITDVFKTSKGKIELLKATTEDSPIAKYIEKKAHELFGMVSPSPESLYVVIGNIQ